MMKSMTGYGRAQRQIDGRDITVEIKSVNHRFFEFSAKIPRAFGYLEEKLKSFLQSTVSRGKVEVGVTILTVEGQAPNVRINHGLADSYLRALRALGQEQGLVDDLTLQSISRFSDIYVVQKAEENEEAVWSSVRTVAEEALSRFIAMREAEGARLQSDLLEKLAAIGELVRSVEIRSPQTVIEYRERLTAKIQEVLGDRSLDESRILTEAAIFAERIAVDEETVRLRSHLGQFEEILRQPEPMGRKLDFLVQEINREANTIGSKAQNVEIAQTVVAIKSEIEKIREQIQNIE